MHSLYANAVSFFHKRPEHPQILVSAGGWGWGCVLEPIPLRYQETAMFMSDMNFLMFMF